MGESEISHLLSIFESIYRFTARGSYVFQVNEKDLAEIDIEVEVYNKILNDADNTQGSLILVLHSNSRESIVTNSYIFSTISVPDWLNKQLKLPIFADLINTNSLFVISQLAQSTKTLQQFGKVTDDAIWEISSRGVFGNERELKDLTEITDKINNNNLSSFNVESFEDYREEIGKWIALKNMTREIDASTKPILFIVITRNGFRFNTIINTGYTLGQLEKTFSVSTNYVDSMDGYARTLTGFTFKPRFKFTEDFKVKDFDKLVDTDAQDFLIKKVRRYALRRVKGGNKAISGEYVSYNNFFSYGPANIDKNFFTPTKSIEKNIYLIPSGHYVNTRNEESIAQLKTGILQFTRRSKNARLGEAIELSVKAYQEAWGSYRPLSKQFFLEENKKYLRVRELFYNILYAYVDKALGGFISTGGERKYSPTIGEEPQVEKLLKASQDITGPLSDEEKETLRYMNRVDSDKYDKGTLFNYFKFINAFMEDRAGWLKNDNIAINKISNQREGKAIVELKRQGFSISQPSIEGGLYLITIEGIESNNSLFGNLKTKYILENEVHRYIERNLYQYFMQIDVKNMDINVIRASFVDDASQFKINFQDWDIRIDLINLINSLISKPKDLVVTDKGRAGLSKPANPAERSMYNLSDERMRSQGVVDHPQTLHYDPMRFNKVTRQRSGHLFFENTDGILVVFPFDTFYHDIEGQGHKTIDICFTSVEHIYDDKLYSIMTKELLKPFVEWIEKNKDIIINAVRKEPIESQNMATEAVNSIFYGQEHGAASPLITPQVFKARVISAIKERLDGHIFQNSRRARSACVYVNTGFDAFYSAGDEGYKLGVTAGDETFPFSWKAFDRFTDKETVSSLDPRRGGYATEIRRLFSGNPMSEFIHIMRPLLEEQIFLNLNHNYESVFYLQLFKDYIQPATYDLVGDDLKLLVREEIKEYLQKNPEAIQLNKIARRNMSGN